MDNAGGDAYARVIAAPMDYNAPSLREAKVTVPDIALDVLAERSDSKQNSMGVKQSFIFSEKDKCMVSFMTEALHSPNVFDETEKVHDLNNVASVSIAGKDVVRIREDREATINAIEAAAQSFHAAGWCKAWLSNCDPAVRGVSATVNGPLCEQLAEATGYHDCGSFTQLRSGAKLLEKLDSSGNGIAMDFEEHMDLCELRADRLEKNKNLLSTLREDEHSSELMALTLKDAQLNRMTMPVPIEDIDLSDIVLAPRFAVVQGVRDDGSIKVRAVDNETVCQNNSCCQPCEKLQYDGLDKFWALLKTVCAAIGAVPGMWKADIDAAYRRIPVWSEHPFAARVVFKLMAYFMFRNIWPRHLGPLLLFILGSGSALLFAMLPGRFCTSRCCVS